MQEKPFISGRSQEETFHPKSVFREHSRTKAFARKSTLEVHLFSQFIYLKPPNQISPAALVGHYPL